MSGQERFSHFLSLRFLVNWNLVSEKCLWMLDRPRTPRPLSVFYYAFLSIGIWFLRSVCGCWAHILGAWEQRELTMWQHEQLFVWFCKLDCQICMFTYIRTCTTSSGNQYDQLAVLPIDHTNTVPNSQNSTIPFELIKLIQVTTSLQV